MNILVSEKIEFQKIIMTFKLFESCIFNFQVTKGESIKDPAFLQTYVVREKSFIKVNVNSISFPKNDNGFFLRISKFNNINIYRCIW